MVCFLCAIYLFVLISIFQGTSHLQAVMVRRHMVYSSEIYEVSHKKCIRIVCFISLLFKYIYITFSEIKPLYQCLIKQSLRKPTILMINFINMAGFNYSVSLLSHREFVIGLCVVCIACLCNRCTEVGLIY